MQEFEVYADSQHKLTLKANGTYTLWEFENGQWYASSTGPHKYMLMVLRDQNLSRIISKIT